ncbi:carbonic anhydrase [Streptomyces sp. NPDC054946]
MVGRVRRLGSCCTALRPASPVPSSAGASRHARPRFLPNGRRAGPARRSALRAGQVSVGRRERRPDRGQRTARQCRPPYRGRMAAADVLPAGGPRGRGPRRQQQPPGTAGRGRGERGRMTVRSAGEVLDEAVLGSIAYGVLELRIPLVLVLAHQSCGAVAAAVHADASGEPLPTHIQYLADQIRPSIDHGRQGEARVDATINAHVRNVRRRLAAEPDLAGRVATGELAVLAARYELRDQHVRTLA